MNRRDEVYCLRRLGGAVSPVASCLLIACCLSAAAQSAADLKSKEKADAPNAVVPLSLRYEEPKTYPIGTKRSAILGDLRCGSDGTIFLVMIDDAAPLANEGNGSGPAVDRMHRFLVTALTPSGDVIQFAHTDIPGLRDFVPEIRYFVSPSRVYTLEFADRYDPADPAKVLGRAHLILIYDYKGAYQGAITLEPGLNPLNIAAFPSGDVLVVSLDKLNQTTRLLVFDEAGRPVKELKLFDEDYALKLQLGAKADNSASARQSVWTHLSVAQWVPFGENLFMSPILGPLPLIEISENGVVRSIDAALPDNGMISGVMESSDKVYHVIASQMTSAADANGQKPFLTPAEIDDIYPGDGTVLKRVKFARGLRPACVGDDSYTFVSPREEDGRLQIIRGIVVH